MSREIPQRLFPLTFYSDAARVRDSVPIRLFRCHRRRWLAELAGMLRKSSGGHAIQRFCSDATFQSSTLVWTGMGTVDPGGGETTSRI